MKHIYLILLVLLLTPMLGVAQDVTITRDQDSGYFLVSNADTLFLADTTYVMGDTLSIDGQTKYNYEYTALRAGLSLLAQEDLYQGAVKVVGGNNFTIGVDLWYIDDYETVYDTVYVASDTVYVEEVITDTLYVDRVDTVYTTEIVRDTVYVEEGVERPLVEAFRNGIQYLPNDSLTVINSYFYTSADSVHAYFDCDTERDPLPRYIYTSSFTDDHEVVFDSFGTKCNTDLDANYYFFAEGDTAEVREDFWPHWATQGEQTETSEYYTDFLPAEVEQWTNIWGTLDYSIDGGLLIVDLPQQNIARVRWDEIPAHEDIRYTITETLHASHSTGAHIGGRHSTTGATKYSVETYVHSQGLGVSIFRNNSWSNPHNFPFEWESGDTVTYTVEIIGDTMRTKIWHEDEAEPDQWMEYTSDEIGAIPSGHFAIGSTGAGLYLIDSIAIDILD